MRVKFTRTFGKAYDKAPREIRAAIDRRLKIFIQNPYHPLLNTHALKGRFSGYKSINITGDWRAIYSVSEVDGTTVIFEIIGTHSQLYA